mgnify:CR=1 FL=1
MVSTKTIAPVLILFLLIPTFVNTSLASQVPVLGMTVHSVIEVDLSSGVDTDGDGLREVYVDISVPSLPVGTWMDVKVEPLRGSAYAVLYAPSYVTVRRMEWDGYVLFRVVGVRSTTYRLKLEERERGARVRVMTPIYQVEGDVVNPRLTGAPAVWGSGGLYTSIDEKGFSPKIEVISPQNVTVAPGQEFDLRISFVIRQFSYFPPGIIWQVYLLYSWAPRWPPPREYYVPLYDGTPTYQGVRVERTVRVKAPTTPGVYYIWVGVCQHYDMERAISGVTQIPPLPAHVKVVVSQQQARDRYEPDNGPSDAKEIRPGERQERSISPRGDVDWAKFTLTSRSRVIIETSGPSGDTVMELYDSRGNKLAEDDDSGQGEFSKIVITLDSGTYYIRVREYGNDEEIPLYYLTLTVESQQQAGQVITRELDLALQASASVSFDLAQSVDNTGDGKKDAYVYINVPSGARRLVVTMNVESDDDADMVLYNPSGYRAGSSTAGTGKPEEIAVDYPVQGRWKLHVYLYRMGGSTARVTVTARVEKERGPEGLEITSVSLTSDKLLADRYRNVLRVNYRTDYPGSYTVYLLHRTTNPMLGGNAYIILEGFQINLRSEGSFDITFAGTPLMLTEESGRAELVVVIYTETSARSVRWAMKSATYEVHKDDPSMRYRIVHDRGTRDIKLLLISETKSSYALGANREPLGVYLVLLRWTSQNVLKSILNSENVYELPGIPEANIYVFFDRRRGPDIDSYMLCERSNAELTMSSIVCLGSRREDFNNWGILVPSIIADRIKSRNAFGLISRYIIGIARQIGDLIKVFIDLYGLRRESLDITEQYPDMFNPNRYVMLSFISVNPPACFLSTVLKVEMLLSFPRAYLTAGTNDVYVIYIIKYDDLLLHGKVSIPLNIRQ